MKMTCFSLALIAGFALLASSAFGQIIYTANNTPGTTNDSLVDGGPATTQIWTIAKTGSAATATTTTISGLKVWDIDANSTSSTITQTTSFEDGALQVGQSVSLEYGMDDSVDDGDTVGLKLLSGSTTEVSVYFLGGQGYDLYTDSTHTGVSTGQYFNENSLMAFSFEVTGTDTYSADLDGHTFTGTFSAPITGIQIFDDDGGPDSAQYSTDLEEPVPEPSTWAMLALGFGVLLITVRPRGKSGLCRKSGKARGGS